MTPVVTPVRVYVQHGVDRVIAEHTPEWAR